MLISQDLTTARSRSLSHAFQARNEGLLHKVFGNEAVATQPERKAVEVRAAAADRLLENLSCPSKAASILPLADLDRPHPRNLTKAATGLGAAVAAEGRPQRIRRRWHERLHRPC